MLVLSYAVGLMAFDAERVVALRGLDAATFKRPVRIGDTIRVRSRVEQVRPLDGEHALVAFAWRIVNQDDQVVVRARLEALWSLDGQGQRGNVAANGGAVDADELYVGTVLL
jgi:acyl dehydratase